MHQCEKCHLFFYSKLDVTRHLYYEKEKEAKQLTLYLRHMNYPRYRPFQKVNKIGM